MSGASVPGPVGSLVSLGAHDAEQIVRIRTARRHEPLTSD